MEVDVGLLQRTNNPFFIQPASHTDAVASQLSFPGGVSSSNPCEKHICVVQNLPHSNKEVRIALSTQSSTSSYPQDVRICEGDL